MKLNVGFAIKYSLGCLIHGGGGGGGGGAGGGIVITTTLQTTFELK